MSKHRLRPRFTHDLDLGVEEARAWIVAKVKEKQEPCEVKNFPGFICLRVPVEDRHFWSPRLNISLDPEGEGKTRVTGLYGPNANMWSSFLYGYLIVGLVGIFSGILGFCQCSLGMQAWGLWIFGTMVAIALGMYMLMQFGREVGAQQMLNIHRIYEDAVERKVELG